MLVYLDHARIRKQKFFHRQRMIRFTKNDGRKQVRTVVPVSETFAITVGGRDITRAGFSQTLLDDRVNTIRDLRVDKGRELCVLVVGSARNDLGQSL